MKVRTWAKSDMQTAKKGTAKGTAKKRKNHKEPGNTEIEVTPLHGQINNPELGVTPLRRPQFLFPNLLQEYNVELSVSGPSGNHPELHDDDDGNYSSKYFPCSH